MEPFEYVMVLVSIIIGLALAACGNDGSTNRSADWTGTVDTLPSGTIIVRNSAGGAIPDVDAAGTPPFFEPDLRLGIADGDGPELFGQVRDIEADALGRIYVLDAQAREIRVFGPNGTHVRNIGRGGEGPGELGEPTGMEWGPDERLWVEDPPNNRYTVFDTTGALVATHPRNMNWRAFTWEAYFDDEGHLYLLERSFTPAGREAWLVRRDTSMAVLDTFPVPEHEPLTYQLVQNGLTRMAAMVQAVVAGDAEPQRPVARARPGVLP